MKNWLCAAGFGFGLSMLISTGLVGCDDSMATKTGDFSGIIKDRIPRRPMANMTAVPLSNTDGSVLPGIEKQVSGSSGMVTFEGLPGDPRGKVGFLVESKEINGELKYIDTYQFNIDVTAQNKDIWSLDKWTFDVAPKLAGVTADLQYGLLAGGFVFLTDAGEMQYVGCATAEITVDGEATGEVRYFGSNTLPTRNRTGPGADPTSGRDWSNPVNGLFTAANIKSGRATIKMWVNGQVMGQEDVIIFGSSPKDALLISDVYVDKTISPENPTPADCK